MHELNFKIENRVWNGESSLHSWLWNFGLWKHLELRIVFSSIFVIGGMGGFSGIYSKGYSSTGFHFIKAIIEMKILHKDLFLLCPENWMCLVVIED